ncbi:MAG: YtxH domain-containing protein [Candidatus Margulisiibacteriota bacterium]|nr:YtxH domain-containing protein [Candidatus Margulisiibacteriota bacterium]
MGKIFKGVTFGGFVGLVLGLLLAPQKGSESRKKLRDSFEKGKEKFDELKGASKKEKEKEEENPPD